ncbi:MAG TPA: glycoside hydrolase family 18 protein [Acidobacteriaceae bacterium]|nr:glycoside hydrolase family 18 protein [Acidobacteriaceae bacterium]
MCLALTCVMFLGCAPAVFAATAGQGQPQVIAYIFPQNSLLQPGEIAVQKLTRINYAFANIKDGKIVEGFPTDPANLATLNALKKENPSLTILVSVGGWLWSGNFSDMALTEHSRKVFINSVIAFIEKYDLDGLDIDWEYPALPGATNHFRPEDTKNYTAVLRELRERFNQEEKKLHRRLYLSIATGGEANFLAHTEMDKVQKYVDTVNLMSYDYHEPDSGPVTGFNAPLYTNPQDPKPASADESVREYEAAGVPARKIVLGVPFYGHAWADVPDVNHGLFQPGKPAPGTSTKYGNIVATIINPMTPDNGFVRYWDPVSKVPYLYNAEKQLFISYDDPESMALKTQYAVDHQLGGIMFWDYSGDPTGVLLDTIDATLFHQPTGAITVTEAR